MDVSLKKFVEPEKNFDILNAQVGGVAYNGFKGQVRFEDVPKPTELKPLVPVAKTEQKKVGDVGVVSETQTEAKTEIKFAVPEALLTYIHKLITNGRKLRALAFDIEFAKSNEEIQKLLLAEFDKGLITAEEKSDMLTTMGNGAAPDTLSKEERLENLKNAHGIIVS